MSHHATAQLSPGCRKQAHERALGAGPPNTDTHRISPPSPPNRDHHNATPTYVLTLPFPQEQQQEGDRPPGTLTRRLPTHRHERGERTRGRRDACSGRGRAEQGVSPGVLQRRRRPGRGPGGERPSTRAPSRLINLPLINLCGNDVIFPFPSNAQSDFDST